MKNLFALSLMAVFSFGLLACGDDYNEETDPCLDVAGHCGEEAAGSQRCNADNTGIETCQLSGGEPACFVWTSTDPCTGSSTCRDGQCEPFCDDACELNETQCLLTVIQTCVMGADACTEWQSGIDCGDSEQLCDDAAEPALCADDCENLCELNAAQCNGTAIEDCVVGASGCTMWQERTDCADNSQACEEADGGPICYTPCENDCTENETQCSGTTKQTCVLGGNNCTSWVDGDDCDDLVTGDLCNDDAEPAVCYTPCVNDCTEGLTQCVGTVKQACVLGGNNCTSWVDG
ncbi:MAG: hypothetical protein KAI66_00295, partial [Lentisphaeria bacterium]|nr:hypothetical protein [Lentisphaeria bacterium]